ncbi:MAG: pentapeptide repeat-containing protein, partial [Thermomicrobiales bacterium]|nr:pentapeptide repeat-containing protein [Thermomicrobiales bacterium]
MARCNHALRRDVHRGTVMDATRFDDFVQSLASPVNRRATIARLLAGLVAPLLPAAADANHGDGKRRDHPRARGRDSDAASGEKGKAKAKAKGRGGHDRGQAHDHGADQSRASGGKHGKQKKKGAKAAGQQPERPHPTSCCSGATCTPGQGRNLPRCCYSGQDLRQGGTSFQGANLANASFAGATLTDLDFRTANLGHACFVDATLTGANLKGANLGGAIFCRTTMPNGSRNDTGCAKGTPCCPTCAETRRCARDQLCCNGNCLTGDCCADGERDACAAGQVCCDHACVSGDCCADA